MLVLYFIGSTSQQKANSNYQEVQMQIIKSSII